MRKAFSARRVPRKIAQDDDEERRESSGGEDSSGMQRSPQCVSIPTLTLGNSELSKLTVRYVEPSLKRPTVKPRKSALRTPFDPSSVDDEDSEPSGVVTPKRSNLSRIVIQRNAEKRSSLLASIVSFLYLEEHED